MAQPTKYGSLTFEQQITYFRNKLNIKTESWLDIYSKQHDWAFVVAGANRDDLLEDFRQAIEKVVAQGETLEQFRKNFDDIVKQYGWDYNGGREWRSRVIYETNLMQSYNAGRHQQLQQFPYWRYRHSDAVETPRLEHLAWDGLVLRSDDPWWRTHFPSNGWGCQCYVEGLTEDDVKALGLDVSSAPPVNWVEKEVGQRSAGGPVTVRVPEGIDPGFEYLPGEKQGV